VNSVDSKNEVSTEAGQLHTDGDTVIWSTRAGLAHDESSIALAMPTKMVLLEIWISRLNVRGSYSRRAAQKCHRMARQPPASQRTISVSFPSQSIENVSLSDWRTTIVATG
jgi:hypothetical protein